MDLETVKKLIKKYIPGHENFIRECRRRKVLLKRQRYFAHKA